MVPAILLAERRGHIKAVFAAAVPALLLAGHLMMPWLLGSTGEIVVLLLIFFGAFQRARRRCCRR